jgi:hypothetical protein
MRGVYSDLTYSVEYVDMTDKPNKDEIIEYLHDILTVLADILEVMKQQQAEKSSALRDRLWNRPL